MKWKDKLLSSSLPLEYEVAKLIASKTLSVDLDYTYQRYDEKEEKEFSVDVRAWGYFPFDEKAPMQINVELLLECKYRNADVSWIFVPDINIETYRNFSSKGTIKVIDEFTGTFSKNSFTQIPFCETCIKGMEINTKTGEVYETGIKHGISQLLYAMPSVLHNYISRNLSNPVDLYPYIICPILVTTANLRILKDDFSIDKIKSSSELDEISEEVPYLRYYSDTYPTFTAHCRNIFSAIPENHQLGSYTYFKALRKLDFKKNGLPKKLYSQPDSLLTGLKLGIENDLFKEMLICNFSKLPDLLNEIESGIKLINEGLEEIKIPEKKTPKK